MLSRETMTTDSTFTAAADATLSAIGAALDAALAGDDNEADNGTDWSLIDGILEIECADGSKLIVNRHVPNREIWVAARSGGFHFRADGNVWRDTRSGGELAAQLAALLRDQAGLQVDLTRLPSPPS
jgi:CyaY protein